MLAGQGVDLGTPGGLALEGDGLPEALHERDAGAGAHEGEELERLLAVERVGEEPGLQVEAGGEEAHQGEADEPSQAARRQAPRPRRDRHRRQADHPGVLAHRPREVGVHEHVPDPGDER